MNLLLETLLRRLTPHGEEFCKSDISTKILLVFPKRWKRILTPPLYSSRAPATYDCYVIKNSTQIAQRWWAFLQVEFNSASKQL